MSIEVGIASLHQCINEQLRSLVNNSKKWLNEGTFQVSKEIKKKCTQITVILKSAVLLKLPGRKGKLFKQ